MSPTLREIEDKLAAIESSSSSSERDRDLDRDSNSVRDPSELTVRQSDHLDKILEEAESDPETSERLAEVAQTIRKEKEQETPEERRARRARHELTEGEEALLDLLTGGSGEVRR